MSKTRRVRHAAVKLPKFDDQLFAMAANPKFANAKKIRERVLQLKQDQPWPGDSRLKDDVAYARLCPAIHVLACARLAATISGSSGGRYYFKLPQKR